MTNIINILLLFCAWLLVVGCGGQTEKHEYKSGRLNYVETLRYGSVGTHGSQGWYVNDRQFYVNGRSWKPEGMNVYDAISGCEASPNESVEALKCYSFEHLKETAFILRMENDKPDWQTLSQQKYDNSKNLGEWLGDGKYLIFKDLLYNVEKNERIEIKGLPDYPKDAFRGTSPDLATIIYQGNCFNNSIEVSEEVSVRVAKFCSKDEMYRQNKIELLWIIEAKTGETKVLELSRDKYDWLIWKQDKFKTRTDWLRFYNQQLVWEKDKDGKFQLVAPK